MLGPVGYTNPTSWKEGERTPWAKGTATAGCKAVSNSWQWEGGLDDE